MDRPQRIEQPNRRLSTSHARGLSPTGMLVGAAVVLLGVLAAGSTACSPPAQTACPGGCRAGYSCDPRTETCQPTRLPAWEDAPPGRNAAIVAARERFWVAARPPNSASVVVGPVESSTPDLRVLVSETGRTADGLALAGGPGGPALAWLTPDRRYRIATRHDERWILFPPIDVDGFDYRGTADFDLSVEPDRTVHLVFRDDRSDALHALHRSGTDPWQAELVDDGTLESVDHGCPQSSPSQRTEGVGHTPDLARIDGDLFVAYYDADCGDLRLAGRPDEPTDRWTITVVDTGDFALGPDMPLRRGDVGRFPALAATPEGRVAVAYQDVGRGRLMYASESNGRFNSELVDPGLELDEFSQKRKMLVGAFADMTIDSDGRPRVVYFNATQNRLQLATRVLDAQNTRRWVHQTLSPPAPAGFSAGIARQADGRERIVAERFAPSSAGPASRMTLVGGNTP